MRSRRGPATKSIRSSRGPAMRSRRSRSISVLSGQCSPKHLHWNLCFFVQKCAFSKHLHWKLCFFVQNVHFRSICIGSCVFLFQNVYFRSSCIANCVFLFKIVYNHCKMYIVHHVRIQRTCFHHGLYHLGCNWEEPPGRRPLGGGLWEYVIGRTPLGGGP